MSQDAADAANASFSSTLSRQSDYPKELTDAEALRRTNNVVLAANLRAIRQAVANIPLAYWDDLRAKNGTRKQHTLADRKKIVR